MCPLKVLPFRRILSSPLYLALPHVDFASACSLGNITRFTSFFKYVALHFLACLVVCCLLVFFSPTLLSTVTTFTRLNLDKRLLDTCRDYAKPVTNPSSLSPTETLVAATTLFPSKSSLSGDPDASKTTRLTDKYPNAFSDFYGCGTPCVFKSGPSWPVNKGPQAQGTVREARPIYDHPIQPVWLDIGTKIS